MSSFTFPPKPIYHLHVLIYVWVLCRCTQHGLPLCTLLSAFGRKLRSTIVVLKASNTQHTSRAKVEEFNLATTLRSVFRYIVALILRDEMGTRMAHDTGYTQRGYV